MVGERVYLRAVERADAAALAGFDAAEAETFMYRGRAPVSPLAYAHMVEGFSKPGPPRWIEFAVCLCADDRLIGNMGVEEIDYVHRTAETGSRIGVSEYRGQGYGTEAKHLLLEYCFDRLHLHALRSAVFAANTRFVAALMKQGYRPAGRLQWADIKDGVYRDPLMFDVTRDEWLAARDAWRAQRVAP